MSYKFAYAGFEIEIEQDQDRLFDACWRQYLRFLNGAVDNPKCQQDVDGWLNNIAAEKVNNPRSSFYIYG